MSDPAHFAPPIEPITRAHDRARFDCGEPSLNEYLAKYALQNHVNDRALTFVALESAVSPQILGYYTLSASSIVPDLLQDADRKNLPRYPVPVTHLGRLAVAIHYRGKGMGKHLLVHALIRINRVAMHELGISAVEVVALNPDAKRFYERFGFTELKDNPFHLYLTTKKIRRWLAQP